MSQINTAIDMARRQREWAVILAGGDGTRLKSLTRKITGDERPKQFCALINRHTLLEQTQRRVQLEFAPHRMLYVLNRTHEPFFEPILAGTEPMNLVIQPCNRGTAPAILYALLRIASIDPNGVVAFFPSDHYVSDDRVFMAHVRHALDATRQDQDKVILLGIDAEYPETEYGWIEPARRMVAQARLYRVRRFWEKPNPLRARVLHLRGCLWNSFVIVARVQVLFDIIESALPNLSQVMTCLTATLGGNEEAQSATRVYENLAEINFSQAVLASFPERLAVAKVTGVRWSDLGEPNRVMASLIRDGYCPPWAKRGVVEAL